MVAAKSTSERVSDYRARLKAQGGREINAALDAEAAKALEAITKRTGESQSEAVCRALVKLNAEEDQQPQE